MAGAGLDENGRNFVSLLAQNRRLGFLPEIAALFEQMKAEVENAVDVEVIAASTLTPDQESRYAAALQKKLGRSVRLHTKVDGSLAGRRRPQGRRSRDRRLHQGPARTPGH